MPERIAVNDWIFEGFSNSELTRTVIVYADGKAELPVRAMCIDVVHVGGLVVYRIQIGIKGRVDFTCRLTDFPFEIRLFAERIFHRHVVFCPTARGFIVLRLHATSNAGRVMQWARPF